MKYEAASKYEIYIYVAIAIFYALSSIFKWFRRQAAEYAKKQNQPQQQRPTYTPSTTTYQPEPERQFQSPYSSQETIEDEAASDTETEYQQTRKHESYEDSDLEDELTTQVEKNKNFSYENNFSESLPLNLSSAEALAKADETSEIETDEEFERIDLAKAVLYSEILKRPVY